MSLIFNKIISLLDLAHSFSNVRLDIVKKSKSPLILIIPLLVISCLSIHNTALAEDASLAFKIEENGVVLEQLPRSVVQAAGEAEFSWDNPHMVPETAYVSSTENVYYYISLYNTPVGDEFIWYVYRPVLDPETYMPTGEVTQHGYGILTRIDEENWQYRTVTYMYSFPHNSGDLTIGVGPYIKDDSGAAYPGIWEETISRNGVLLTTGNFELVDDLAPEVSFITPADGSTSKGSVEVSVASSDNLAVTKLELYADNAVTNESHLLYTYINPPSFPVYMWDVSNYSDGEYILRAQAYDPYDNVGIASTVVNVANKSTLTQQLPTVKTTQVAEPINVANGNVSMQKTDILIPFREIPLELSRTYNSQDKIAGSFGFCWRSNFDVILDEQPDDSVVESDGEGVYTIYSSNGDGTYTPSAGKFSQLTKNQDGTYTIIRKHGRKLFFDTAGKLTRIEEKNGNYLTITRLANSAISEVSDSSGRRLLFASDAEGRITEVTDPAGRVFNYNYDDQGNLIETIEPVRNKTVYAYDANHNLTSKTDPNGHSLYFEYDSADHAYHSWQDDGNNEITLNFDWLNKITTTTDSLGNATIYEFNSYGLVTKTTDAEGNFELAVWDDEFNKTSSTDKNGNISNFTYDARGNLTTATDPLIHTTSFTYEPNFDLLESTTDALGNITEYSYDAKGNLILVTDALGNITAHSYDSSGQLVQTKDANDNATIFGYDPHGNLIQVTDALGNQKSFAYDAIGKVVQETDALGNVTLFEYDSLGYLTKTTYADGSNTTSIYDAVGNQVSFTDQLRCVTKYTYDAVDRLVTTTDALKKELTNTYDTEGNITSVTDANLQQTQYFYNSLGRLIKTVDPLGNQTQFSYDPQGNLVSKTDANNNTITYNYDVNNRLTQTVYPDSSSVTFAYDALGRKTSMSESSGITVYSYDALSCLIQVDGPQTSDTISYAYDKVGNRIQMVNADGEITEYTYDALNRVAALTDPQGNHTTYSYNAVGNLIQTNYPNNMKAVFTFDALNRLTSLSNQNGAMIISSYDYSYNDAGMRTEVVLSNGDYIKYTYDKLNRLTSEKRYKPRKTLLYELSYSYDAVGNRLSEDIDISDPNFKIADYPATSNLTYTYNAANQLINLTVGEVNRKKVTIINEISYSYDQNGNLIQQGDSQNETNYTYDFENRLVSVSGPSVNASYEYDGEGKRISKVEGGLTTNFFYDGMNVILERDDLNQRIASYARGLNYAGGIGGIISSYDAGNTDTLYLYDGLGSVTELADAQGDIQVAYTYDAFGNVLAKTGTAVNSYQFQTKEASTTTGLVYFGARYYNPLLGRFITQDPSGMIDGPNLYVYVNNNPVNLIDPYGLCREDKWKWGQENWLWQVVNGINFQVVQPGENWEAYFARFRANYPYQFAVSESLSLFSFSGWALSGTVEAGYRYITRQAATAFTSIGWGNGAYVSGYNSKLLLNQGQGGLKGASNGLLGIGISATAYRIGLQINAWIGYRLTPYISD